MNSNFAVIVEDLSVLKTTWKREKCSSSYIPFCFTFLSKPCNQTSFVVTFACSQKEEARTEVVERVEVLKALFCYDRGWKRATLCLSCVT